MAKKPIPTPEELRQLLDYQPETGKLFWKHREKCKGGFNRQFAGKEAITATDNYGYKVGMVNKQTFKAHRISWAVYYGEWPSGDIDHINGDPSDNRITNLRDVNRFINMRNRKRNKNNTSGHIGVYWHSETGKWRAGAKVAGKTKHLGLFEDIESAIAARAEFEEKHGYSCSHGNC